jgi:SAM-dependent methyltransferase
VTEPLPEGVRADSTEVALLEDVYARRFPDREVEKKDEMWKVIGGYLQRYVPRDGVVLDLACDHGDFIRHVAARERWAADVRDVSHHLPEDVRFAQCEGLAIADVLPNEHFDLVFMSNYLEHLPTGDHVIEQLRAVRRVLRPGGMVLILQPNIRLTGSAYWDFIDHKVALTDRSLTEAAELAGFATEQLVRRFLPYTTKGRLPVSPPLVRLYLKLPLAWRLLGQQTLFLARRV